MRIVNGYVCQTGCDVAAARRGHDPRNPHDDPVKAEKPDAARHPERAGGPGGDAPIGLSPDGGFAVEAVRFGGRLAELGPARGSVATGSPLLDRLA